MEITPVRNKKDYMSALKRVEELMGAKKYSKEGDELDILVTLIEAYERKNIPFDNPDPIAVIEHCMEALGYSRKDLEPIIGSSGRVSEVLNKKRALTMPMVRNLHQELGIPAHALIQEYEIEKKKA